MSGPVRVEMSGEAATVVQAGVISGGVHLGRPAVAPSPPRPVREWHPFDLDVHRAVGPVELPYLPAYLPRAHDAAPAGWLRWRSGRCWSCPGRSWCWARCGPATGRPC